YRPPGADEAELEALNAALLERLNATGEVFLSHTRVNGKFALRLAIGNLRTTKSHVRRVWELARSLAHTWPVAGPLDEQPGRPRTCTRSTSPWSACTWP